MGTKTESMIQSLMDEGSKPAPAVRRTCPDDGCCHHKCGPDDKCFRSTYCLPLSGSGLNDDWTPKAAGLEVAVKVAS